MFRFLLGALKGATETAGGVFKATARSVPGVARLGLFTAKAGVKAGKLGYNIAVSQSNRWLAGAIPSLGSKILFGGAAAVGGSMLAYKLVNHRYDMQGEGIQIGPNPYRPYMSTPMDFSYRTNFRSMNAGGDLTLALHNLR